MKKLQFDYWTEFKYTAPVTECHYTFKCLPKNTDMQEIADTLITLTPEHDCQRGFDSFGNLTVHDDLYVPHTEFALRVTGTAVTGRAGGERVQPGEFTGIYRYPHGLNRSSSQIKQWHQQNMALCSAADDREKAQYLMDCLHRDFIYEKGITNVDTTAAQAWSLGRGVCQDYAHIFICLCHLSGMTARYVTGMMLGEGYSHAWVEVLCQDTWYGFDPTNGCTVGENYIKISAGRDARDCMINRGVLKGGGQETQTVAVRVEEL